MKQFVRFYLSLMLVCFGMSFGRTQDSVIRVHDPVMIKEGDTYHLFCTGFGISHFTSQDLQNWDKKEPVFAEKPSWADQVVPGFRNHIWAPDILKHEGTFYLYYSVSAFGKNTSAIGLATNKSLEPGAKDNKWMDQGIVIQSIPNKDLWNAIDPNVILDDGGTPWLSFGSFWDGLKLTKLDKDFKNLSVKQEWHTLARRERSFELGDDNPGDAALEAPFIFRKDGWYYLFLSWDYCCKGSESTYKVVVGRSKNLEGPYFDKDQKSLFHGGGSLVLEGNANYAGAGHCSVYSVDGKDLILFHAYDQSRKGMPVLKIKPLEWDEAGWPRRITNL